MSKPRIIADDKIPFLKGALEEVSEITYVPGSEINNRMVKEADALIIRTRTKCNKDLLDGSNVKFIASATIGFDHIDTGYCSMESIQWTNAPGCNSSSVEQYVTAALMNLAEKHGFLLKEKTLGIIGVGNVGQKVSRIAHSLGMHVLHNDPPREKQEGSLGFHSLDKIKEEADFISFHVPLNIAGEYRTLDFVNQDFIHELKKNVMVINTSRGEIMEEDT
ncbi:MAG: 4-phosphoerythronate dehydrogenase, partial [Bacteroidota bacterium]